MSRQPRARKSSRALPRRAGRSALQLESLETRRLLAADVAALSPLDGAANVDVNANLVLTFTSDVEVGPGAGRLLIKNAADDSVVEAIQLDSNRVQINGATVTVDPVNPLPADAKLYVEIDAAAVRDTSSTKADGVLFRENFETLPLIDSALDNPSLDRYAAFSNGTLDVKTAGDYRFGTRNDDGGYLVIDLNNDGKADVNDPADLVIFDDTTHGLTDFFAENAITLSKGQYKFEYLYFDAGGGGGGEFFYAPDNGDLGAPVAFDPAKFAVVGDASKGIGLTAEQIKVTVYQAAGATAVGNIQAALDMRDGNLEVAQGFPQEATISTADLWDSGNKGYYSADHLVPGTPPPPANDADFSANPPFGWVRQNSEDNIQPEYNGWGFLDKEFWIAQQGDQDRTSFTKGEGTVAVMDPDAFDDFVDIDDVPLEAFLTLPAIDLTGVTANSVKLNFDSSWRPYQDMTGLIDISFDGGTTWANLLTLDNADGDSSLARADEAVSLDIANPSGGALLVRFGMTNCNNDWWWAVDNIEVTGQATGDLYDGINDRTTWNFQTATALAGDFNVDHKVDLTDFGILKGNFGKTPATLAEGDANGDAKVDLTDFGILKDNFGKTGAVPAPAVVAQATDYVFAVAINQAALESAAATDPFADEGLSG